MTRIRITCVFLFVTLAMGQARAAVMLTLASSPTDLSSLVVGNTVDITVNLTGLAGMQFSALGATVQFPSGVFGTPISSAAGSIVPDPSDLILTPLSGAMDGQYFAFNGGNIASDGDFLTFRVNASAPGSGVFRFDPLSLFALDDIGNPFFDFDTNELPFTVRQDGTVVPEPASALLLVLSGLAVLPQYYRRRCSRMAVIKLKSADETYKLSHQTLRA